MREIKFRAWDEQNKIMHNDVEFIRSGIEGNDWIIFKSDKQKLEDQKVLDNPYFAQQIKLMQFTGFYDKDADEIYEGDIVKGVARADHFTNYHSVVEMINGCWALRIADDDFLPLSRMDYGIEILGNIYENPDLLDSKVPA